jgi:hypothetical protein
VCVISSFLLTQTLGVVRLQMAEYQDGQASLIVVTAREAVLNAASLKDQIMVTGKIVYLDNESNRMDITTEGAKLIIDFTSVDTNIVFGIDDEVMVTGKLKRMQRRLFFQATKINKM